jgi:hypothetical protein
MAGDAKGAQEEPFAFDWRLEALLGLSGLGAATGTFLCGFVRYMLRTREYDYGEWAGRGGAIGFTVALLWIITDYLFSI